MKLTHETLGEMENAVEDMKEALERLKAAVESSNHHGVQLRSKSYFLSHISTALGSDVRSMYSAQDALNEYREDLDAQEHGNSRRREWSRDS